MLAASTRAILSVVLPTAAPGLRLLVRHSAGVEDVTLAEQLLRHLDILKRFSGVDVWSDTRIQAGDDARGEVERAIQQADVALLLLSADFFASDFLQEVEVPRLLERHRSGELRVIPVLLRSCVWEVHPWLSELPALPRHRKAIGSFSGDDRDRVLTEVVKEIVGLVSLSPPGAQRSTLPNYDRLPFVGRCAEREALESAFADGDRPAVVVLHGEPGVGKTRLAVEYAQAHLGRYPGGVFFVRFDALPPLDLVEILRLLGLRDYEREPLEAQCRRALRSLGAEPTLLLYDGVPSEADLDAWLPPGGLQCHVLATSTNRDWTARHATCPVPVLSDDDAQVVAAALLGGPEVAGRYVEGLVRHAHGIAVQLCPNAVAVARAVAHGHAPELEALAEETRKSFGVAWALLPADARLLLRAAALFEGSSVLAEQVRELLESERWQGRRFEQALDDAIDRCLLTRAGDSLRMHDLLRRFVFEQGDPSLGGDLLRRYVNGAEQAAKSAREKPADAVLVSRLRSYPVAASWERFVEVLRSEAGDVAHAHGVALLGSGKWDAARGWYERAAEAKSRGDAQRRVNHESVGRSLHEVGYCLWMTGRFHEAKHWFERAVAAHEKGDAHGHVDQGSLGTSLNLVGKCLSDIGQFDEARVWYERAVAAKGRGDVHGRVDHESLGRSLNQVGHCLSSTGRFDEARPWFERAVAVHEKGDVRGRVDHGSIGMSLNQVGNCLLSTGRFDEARPWFERAVAAHEKGDVHGRVDHQQLGKSLSQMCTCLLSTGRFEEARPWSERAVAAHEKGDVHGRVDYTSLGVSLNHMGKCLSGTGRFDEARAWYERAVAAKERGDVHGRVDQGSLGRTLNQVGHCLSSTGRFDEAWPWLERAVAAHEKGDVHGRINHHELGKSLSHVAYCLFSTGRFDEARPWYERAVAAHEKGDLHGRVDLQEFGKCLHGVGYCLWKTGRSDGARSWLERAIAAKEKGDIHGRVDQASLAFSRRVLEAITGRTRAPTTAIRAEHPCPCGSGALFHECHGAPDEQGV